MTRDLEFRLIGGSTPDGEIRLRDLAALTEALQELSLRIGRECINATGPGRTKLFMEELTELRLSSISAGSTRLVFSKGPTDKLDVSVDEQRIVDDRFWDVIAAVGDDARPDWVTDLVAESAAKLVAALKATAPKVDVSSPGRSSVHMVTERIHTDTWVGPRTRMTSQMSAAGRLEKVDLRAHEFRIRDDAGNAVELKHVDNDRVVAQLVGRWVIARGQGILERHGNLVALDAAQLETAHDPAMPYTVRPPVSLESILATAGGPDPAGGLSLDDDEFAAFLEAARS